MIKKRILIIALSVVVVAAVGTGLFFALSGNQKYTGFVRETGSDAPLAGVAVTDGRNVVKTGEDGSFTLGGYRKTRFITMTVPSGFTAKTYYISASKETASYDFTLEREAVPTQEHTFIQIADTEIGEKGTGPWLEETKRLIQEVKPSFLMHTGDICYEDGLKRHIVDMNSDNMGCQVRYMIGNHDYVDGDYGEQLYESLYGPVWYSFEVGNVHYVVTPIQNGDYASGYNKNDRWRWLENDLKNTDPNKKVVIFNHTNFPGDSDYVLKFGRNSLDLKAHNLAAWIFGHYHYNFINETNGVLNISTARPDCGGIDQSASALRQIKVDRDGGLTTKLHYYDMANQTPVTPEESLWSTQVKGNALFCDTLTVGDRVFVGTIDDDYPRACGVYALDAKTGALLWEFGTKNSVKNNLGYWDGKVIAQDCEGRVYCLDETNGTLLWQKDLELNQPGNSSLGICVADGVAYTGNGTRVTALDVKTGEVRWTAPDQGGDSSPARMVVSNGKLIVSSHWNQLYALETTTGKLLWKMKDDGLRYRSTTPYCMEDGTILVAATDKLFLIDGTKGTVLKQQAFENYNFDVAAQPLVDGNVAYLPSADNGVAAFDVKTLKELWRFNTKKSLVYTSPYVGGDAQTVESTLRLKGDSLVFGASDGFVYTIDKQTGSLQKEVSLGAPVFGAVSIYEDSVICADFTGRITRLP